MLLNDDGCRLIQNAKIFICSLSKDSGTLTIVALHNAHAMAGYLEQSRLAKKAGRFPRCGYTTWCEQLSDLLGFATPLIALLGI